MFKRFWVLTVVVLILAMSANALAAPKVYRVALHDEPKSNNVVAAIGTDATSWSFAVLMPQYKSLYGVYAPKFTFGPTLAAGDPGAFKKEVGADGKEYYTSVIPIRKDIYWSDGQKFTAADVEFTYSAIMEVGPNNLGANWGSNVNTDVLSKVEALDDYTIKFWLQKKDEDGNLAVPGLSEWQYNALQVIILSKKHWEPIFDAALKTQDPVKYIYAYDDASPVTLAEYIGGQWETGAFYEIKKNPSAVWQYEDVTFLSGGGLSIKNNKTGFTYKSGNGEPELTVKGGPDADAALYRLYLNQNAAVLALQKGEVDYWLNPVGLNKGFQQQLERSKDVQIIKNAQNGYRFVAFNATRKPMNDKVFRQAVATLVDRDWVAQNVLQGVIEPVASAVPPGNSFWYNPDVKVWGAGMSEYERIDAAKKLLKDAGYSWEEEPMVDEENGLTPGRGLKGPDGKLIGRIEFLAPTPGYDPLRANFALWIERWMQNLGIDARAKLSEFNVLSDKMNNMDYDMLMLGFGLTTYPDHMDAFFASEGAWNICGYANPEFDKVDAKFVSATSMEEAQKYAYEMQEILAEDVPWMILFVNPITEGYRKDNVKYQFTEVLDGFQNLYGVPDSVLVLE